MNNSRLLILWLSLLLSLGFTVFANAALNDNHDGTVTDTDRNLMWLQDANTALTTGYDTDGMMTWSQAQTWIGSLNSSNYLGYSNWRLPTTLQPDIGCTNQDGASYGYNCSGSEMGHLYYYENTGLLTNLQNSAYWSGTEYVSDPSSAWYFRFNGYQNHNSKGVDSYVMAVRDVGVAPEPVSSVLFIMGGAILAGRRLLRRKV